MTKLVKKLVNRKRGMEALQAILLLAAAFVMVQALKSLSGDAATAGKAGITKSFQGTQ